MILTKTQLYKVVEFDKGIVILHQDDNLGGRNDMVPLIIADMPTICEYLPRYHELRAAGVEWREAHQRALEGAVVVDPGVQMPGNEKSLLTQ